MYTIHVLRNNDIKSEYIASGMNDVEYLAKELDASENVVIYSIITGTHFHAVPWRSNKCRTSEEDWLVED